MRPAKPLVHVLVLVLLLLVGVWTPASAQKLADGPTLQSSSLRLAFSPKDGRLTELLDRSSGVSFLVPGGDASGIWALDRYDGGPAVTPAQARRFAWSRVPGKVPALRLAWSDFALPQGHAAPGLTVTATISLGAHAADSEWRFALEGSTGVLVERVRYPRLAGIEGDAPLALAVPRWMGALAHDGRALLLGQDGKGRRLEWPYPGTMSFQALALYRAGPAGGPGLYLAAEDSMAWRKDFALWGESAGAAASPAGRRAALLGYELGTLLPDPQKPHAGWVMPYAAVVGAFTGDWITVAEHYRAWGERQSWARNARLVTGKVPAWLTGTGMWIWNRGRSPGVVPPALALERALGLPVSVYWHWWHHGPYDTSFPDYLPPREGVDSFTAAVKRLHAAGLHAMVYMNQRLWCTGTPSWKQTDAARFAVKEKDGKVREEVYNIFDPQACATMDVTTPFWRAKYAGMADTVVNQYGVDGVYMDQAVQSLVCWDPSHGHPLGGGHYWMDGWRRLEHEIRQRMADRPGRMLAGEGAGETWLPNLDLMLTLQVSQERYSDPGSGWDPIPFWQAVYHRFGLTYGNYSSLHMPPYDDLWPKQFAPKEPLALLDTVFRSQFFLEQARAFVWGLQPTIANFQVRDLAARPVETAYMVRLARLRAKLPGYFIGGTFLRPPALRVPEQAIDLSRISIYAAQRAGPTTSRATFPAAIAGAFRARDGNVAVAVASILDRPVRVAFDLDPRAYGLAGGGRVARIDEAGTTSLGRFGQAPLPIRLELPAGGAVVIELRRDGAGDAATASGTER